MPYDGRPSEAIIQRPSEAIICGFRGLRSFRGLTSLGDARGLWGLRIPRGLRGFRGLEALGALHQGLIGRSKAL